MAQHKPEDIAKSIYQARNQAGLLNNAINPLELETE